jgi:hypothetical protein
MVSIYIRQNQFLTKGNRDGRENYRERERDNEREKLPIGRRKLEKDVKKKLQFLLRKSDGIESIINPIRIR